MGYRAAAMVAVVCVVLPLTGAAGQTIAPLRTVADIDIGQTQTVKLTDGTQVTVSILSAEDTRDEFRDAVRSSRVKVSVNGQEVTLDSGNYNLPVSAGGILIDCPLTKAYYSNSQSDPWGLECDVRLRLWPAGSPFINPGTFAYPAGQRWFASDTQMSNEPVFVDAGEEPSNKKIYYHNGLDIGGPEGMVDVFSATDGLVVSKGIQALEGQEKDTPVDPRYDVIYILDDRGWYYRYSHLKSFETNVLPGERVRMGQKIGELGKEGGSGGWTHLHFEIISRQPSGKWGTEEGYVYLWEAYAAQYKPSLIAVARPHQLAAAGQKVLLKGDKSRCFDGSIVSYEWLLSDGTKATGPVIEHVYGQPGIYSEILKVTDSRGNVDYDFTVVNVIDKNRPDTLPPTIHVTYSPSFDIQPGDPVTFKVRSFRTGPGRETWDFGDGSPGETTASNPPGDQHDPQGYAVIVHRFKKAGLYLVRVGRTGENGFKAVGHVDLLVGKGTEK